MRWVPQIVSTLALTASAMAAPVNATLAAPSLSTQLHRLPEKRTFALRIAPLHLAIGIFQSDVDIPVARRVSLGPTAMLLVNDEFQQDGKIVKAELNHFGMRATISLTGTALRSGFILTPYFSFAFGESQKKIGDDFVLERLHGLSIATTFGYQYVSDFGMAFRFAGGPRLYSLASNVGPGQMMWAPEIDLSLGWVF